MEATDLSRINLSEVVWRKSSRSGPNGGECVEVASNLAGTVAVRDSKNPSGAVLAFTSYEWGAFLGRVKRGDFGDLY